jgi:hypothetical protein
MRFTLAARDALDADVDRIRQEHLVVLELCDLTELEQSRVEEIGATLMAVRRLPGDLTLRVALPEQAAVSPSATEAEAALHRDALTLSSASWREAMGIRATGMAQLPLGMLIAAGCWVAAYVLAYLAAQVDGGGAGLLAVTAMLVITIAWVISWVTVEAAVLDWRVPARQAAAYDLLARARLEVTHDGKR